MKKKIEGQFERTFTIEREGFSEDARTVEIAFSSEEPYERAFGTEVLDHNPQSVRLDRLNGGAAVLVNHDSNDQVGVVESARIDGDGKGRAVIRFSRSARGQDIYQDVQDGIRSLVSVGYRIHGWDVTERDGQSDLVRVTDWEPYEVSVVAIPADATVGVGRSESESEDTLPTKATHTEEIVMSEEVEVKQETAFDEKAALNKLRTDESKRVDAIRSLADRHELDELGREAITEGWTVSEFNTKALEVVGERNSKARVDTSHDGEVDVSDRERRKFSLTKLMHAIANPQDRTAQNAAGFELEVSAEAVRGFGNDFNCRGVFVPTSMLNRDLSVGSDGSLVGTDHLGQSYIEVLRNASSVTRAGMTILSGLVGNVAIPRQATAASSTWISAEDGDATESEATFEQVTLSPKDLACYTEVTRRLTLQSSPAIEGIIRNDLAMAQALGIDSAALYGTGTGGQPTGIAKTTGINAVNFAASAPTYAEIVQMIKEVMADNALMGNVSWLIEANGWDSLSTTPRQASGVEGNFILDMTDRIKGYPYIMSNQVTDNDYFFGNWSDLLMGEWGGLEVNVDPYTSSLKGKVRYVTFKTVDLAVRHPVSFCIGHANS